MSAQTFKATHCGETFAGSEGVKALESHMKAHRAERPRTYLTLSAQPSHKPSPWRAPKAPTDTRKLTEVLAKASKETDAVVNWATAEKAVPVGELKAGDVFIFGRTYVVTAVEGDTLELLARKDRHYPEATAKMTLAQIEAKAPTVALIKRAA